MSYEIKLNAFSFALNRARAHRTRENKPGLTSRRERNHLFEYRLHKTRTVRIGSQPSSRPYRSNDDVVVLVPRVIFNNGSSETGFGQENRHIFTLSFSFQINISVKSSVGLLRNLCGNLVERYVSDQSSGLKRCSSGG